MILIKISRKSAINIQCFSLSNTYSEGEVNEFYQRVRKALNEEFEICCEMKYDGTSISLIYEDGKLMRAVTRGDGEKKAMMLQTM